MDRVSDLIKLIEESPQKYIVRRSAFTLQNYLDFYMYSFTKIRGWSEQIAFFALKFDGWLKDKIGIKSNYLWSQLLDLNAEDDRDAYLKFFHFYRQFAVEFHQKSQPELEELLPKNKSPSIELEGIHDFLTKTSRFLVRPSAFTLESAFNGYLEARNENSVLLSQEEEYFIQQFKLWVQSSLGVQSGSSWSHIISFRAGNEKHSYKLAVDLIDTFFTEIANSKK